MQRPRFSVVVPTWQRREDVVRHVLALAGQTQAPAFEVIVVIDGSTDGTAEALRALTTPFPLQVVTQANAGAGAARNRGARAAAGEILLFLDDDMEPDPGLLAAHDRRHCAGADAVVGHMPLHPDSPPGFLARDTGSWVEHRRRTLASDTPLPGESLLTGQFSVSKRRFDAIHGFDERFTRAGAYGGEDTDFGLRLVAAGARLVFEPSAVSRQLYRIDLRAYLRRHRQVGRAFVELLRKHPDLPETVVRRDLRPSRLDRWLAPAAERLIVSRLARGGDHPRLERLFYRLQAHHYWVGVRRAGGYPRRRAFRVLAYHALRDLAGAPVAGRYGVAADELRRQLGRLRRLGFHFVSPDEVVAYLTAGGGLPRRAVLLTFDDAYAELAKAGLAVLADYGAAAAVFVPADKVGGHNDWDTRHGAPRLALCDADELRKLAASGVEVGSHGASHARLDQLDATGLVAELEGSASSLEALGLPRPRLLAYPYGAADALVRSAARRAGYVAGFTVEPGLVRPTSDPLALPRIEIRAEDRGWRFLVRVLWAGGPWRRRSLTPP